VKNLESVQWTHFTHDLVMSSYCLWCTLYTDTCTAIFEDRHDSLVTRPHGEY